MRVAAPGSEWEQAWALYQAKFPFVDQFKQPLAHTTLYVFEPEWIRRVDNRQGFGFKEEKKLLKEIIMAVSSQVSEAYLAKKYPLADLKAILKPRDQWKPFPTAADRAGWEALPEAVRGAQIALGERALTLPWPHLDATTYLQFARTGNRSQYEAPYFVRRDILGTLVIAECCEGKGRFLDAITNAVWSICEESSWVLPAHMYIQGDEPGLPDTAAPVVDLFAAETAALVAWTVYLVGDALQSVSPLIRARLEREIDARVLTPNLERDDFWWMGFMPSQGQ